MRIIKVKNYDEVSVKTANLIFHRSQRSISMSTEESKEVMRRATGVLCTKIFFSTSM